MSLFSKLSVSEMTAISLLSAVLCIFAPLSIPIGAIPLSLTNFLLYTMLLTFGCKRVLFSYCIYLLLGMAGLPVFSGFSGGFAKIAGPTGGYLFGFFFLILLFKLPFQQKHPLFLPALYLVLGSIAAYLFGSIWYCMQTQSTLLTALTICVFPFIPVDILKIIAALKIAPNLRNTLQKAHLLS